MATLAPRPLLSLNTERRVSDRRDALDAALSMPIAPAIYRSDLIACLGLDAVSDASLERAALHLPEAMLAFLRSRCPDVDPQPWISQSLLDGTLGRHLLT